MDYLAPHRLGNFVEIRFPGHHRQTLVLEQFPGLSIAISSPNNSGLSRGE